MRKEGRERRGSRELVLCPIKKKIKLGAYGLAVCSTFILWKRKIDMANSILKY